MIIGISTCNSSQTKYTKDKSTYTTGTGVPTPEFCKIMMSYK